MPPVKPKQSEATPKGLKPYVFHGLDLSHSNGDANAVTDCPFCGKENKFSVQVETGIARCFVCSTGNDKGGLNPLSFIRKLWSASEEATRTQDYDPLASDRGLLHAETLIAWEVVRSVTTGEWLVPGYGADGRLHQLYRYSRYLADSKWKYRLMATPGVHDEGKAQGIHGVHLYDKGKSSVHLHESFWNALAEWEVLRQARADEDDGGRLRFSGEAASLASDVNVLAAPGCGYFSESWLPLLAGKDVVMMYDSDHPNPHTKRSPGYEGMRRLAEMASNAEQPPSSLRFVRWGEDGYDPSLKSGYDVRDHLSSAGDTLESRLPALRTLLDRVTVIPDSWVRGRSGYSKRNGKVEVELIPCTDWRTLRNAWMRCMKWTGGLDDGLSFVLAVAISTDLSHDDQLWGKLIGPPASGKTTIIEGLSTCKRYVYANSTMTGIHSGWKTDNKGEEDHSLAAKIKGKTLAIKDGDTLLQAANKDKILAELRDLYDRCARVHYGHGVSRQYEDHPTTLLLCGTEALRSLDDSELGERFVDCVIMHGIDEDHEDEINARMAARVVGNLRGETAREGGATIGEAQRMTGGYLEHLRGVVRERMETVEAHQESLDRIIACAKFVAYMRARPSARQRESAGREFSGRLVAQLIRLGMCLAVVKGKTGLDEDVLGCVRRRAMDTARGVTLEIAAVLRREGRVRGSTVQTIREDVKSLTDDKIRAMLRFLRQINVVEEFLWSDPLAKGVNPPKLRRHRLTERMESLYDEVVNPSGD